MALTQDAARQEAYKHGYRNGWLDAGVVGLPKLVSLSTWNGYASGYSDGYDARCKAGRVDPGKTWHESYLDNTFAQYLGKGELPKVAGWLQGLLAETSNKGE